MKILISNNETYEYKLNNTSTITVREFNELLVKLNSLVKIFAKNTVNPLTIVKSNKSTKSNNYPKQRKQRSAGSHRDWCDTREKTLNLLKLHYFGTKEQKQELSKEAGIPWLDMTKGFWSLKRRYKIEPREIGLQRWNDVGERNNKDNTSYYNQ